MRDLCCPCIKSITVREQGSANMPFNLIYLLFALTQDFADPFCLSPHPVNSLPFLKQFVPCHVNRTALHLTDKSMRSSTHLSACHNRSFFYSFVTLYT